jgi:hypothetical protein
MIAFFFIKISFIGKYNKYLKLLLKFACIYIIPISQISNNQINMKIQKIIKDYFTI